MSTPSAVLRELCGGPRYHPRSTLASGEDDGRGSGQNTRMIMQLFVSVRAANVTRVQERQGLGERKSADCFGPPSPARRARAKQLRGAMKYSMSVSSSRRKSRKVTGGFHVL